MAYAYSYTTGCSLVSPRIQGQTPRLRESVTQAFKGLLKAALAGALLAATLVAVPGDAHAAATPEPMPDGSGTIGSREREVSAAYSLPAVEHPEIASGAVLALDAQRVRRDIRREFTSLARSATADPVVGVRIERSSYRFTEGEEDARVAVVAETAAGRFPDREPARATATPRNDAMVVVSSLHAESETVTEGSDAVFILTRTGDTSAEASVGVDIRGHRKIMSGETRSLLDRRRPDGMATFAAGSSTAEFALSTEADIRIEGNGELILQIARAENVSVTGARSARVLVEDDDVPELTLELRANGELVRPQGDVLRAEVDEGSPPDVQYRFVCPTAGYEYGVFDWGTSFPWVAGEYDGRHPIWKSYGNIFRYVCNRDGTRFLHNSWAGPTDGEINLHLVSANLDNWINEVDPSHHGYRYAVDPDRVSFGRCRGEFCPRYTIGSPNRIEITLLNANPVISVEALDAEVEEGDTARFRLTRHWPEDRWNEEFLNEALATTRVLLGSIEFGEATNESLPTQHSFGVREGSVVFEVPTIEDESPDSGERSITIEVLPDTTPQGVNPAGKYDVVDVIPGVTPEGGNARTATVRIREDDEYPAIEISDATAIEGANSIEFTVTLNQAAELDATVDWNLSFGTATAGEDYVVVSGTLSFPAGSTMATIDVPLIDDLVAEESETFAVTLSNPVNVRLMENAVENPEIFAFGTIEDNDEPSTEVAVSLSIHEVAESAGIRGGIVAVSASLNNAAFVQDTVLVVRVGDGTAQAPEDYARVEDFPLTLEAGTTSGSASFTLRPVDDSMDEDDETISVAVTGKSDLEIVWNGASELVISDDDTRGVTVSPVSLTVDEGATATYTVRLASEPTGNVSVAPFHAGGDPDVAATPVLTFDSSNWYLAQTVTVTAAEDPDAEDDAAEIGHRVSGADYGTVPAESVAVTVTDDETESSEVLLAADPSVVREGAEAVPITVTARLASGSRDVDTVIGISVAPGSAVEGADYAAVPPFAITIPADAVSGTHAFSFSTAPDDLDEPAETVRIAGAVSDSALAVSSALLTIEDSNAVPTVSLMLSNDSIGEAGGESTVTAFMSHASSAETTVTIAVAPVEPAEARDFKLSGTTLSIPAGWTTSSGAIVITALDNDVNSRDKTLKISGTVANRLGLADPAEVSLTITDDDRAGVSASPASLLVMEEDASGTVYSVVLDSEPIGPVAVSVSGMAGSDVSVSPARLAFTPANWDEAQEVLVTAGADDDSRDDRVVLEHHAAGGGYSDAGTPSVAVVVFDNDRRIVLSVDPPNIAEGAGATDIVVKATHAEEAADVPVTVHVTVGSGSAPNPAIAGADFEPVGSFAIVIPDGAGSGTGIFTFTPIEDEEVEEDEMVSITGASDTLAVGVSGAELVITDNDEHPLRALSILDSTGAENDGSISFEVRLDAASSALVRVRYATEDGTALAGIDYEPRRGILAIAPGALSAELTVPVHMDSVDEGKEQFRVRLSDPEHAILADSEAVGTITNSDPLPSAWLIRFGRTVAEDIAGSVASRAETAQASGVEVEIANQFLGGLPDAEIEDPYAAPSRSTARRSESGNFTRSWSVTQEEFLDGSSIKATKAVADGGALSVWGSGSVSRFTGSEQGVSLEGEASTGILGADYRSGSRAIGFLLSRSTGKGTYGSGDVVGRITAKMAGLYPFFHVHPMDRYSIWGVAGHGRGKIRLEPRVGPVSEAGISMAMAALGTRGVVGNASGIDVAVETDGFLVRTRSEAVPGLNATDSQAGRVRVGLEGTAALEIDGFGTIVPRVGLGMRYDSGDAESGYGIDLGGGLALNGVRTGISVELQGRALLVHEAARVSDWGWSGTLHFDPAPSSDRGVDFSLSSSRGASTEGRADALRDMETVGGLLEGSTGSLATSIDAEIGYGVLVAGGKFTGRPAIGIGASGSERTYRTGYTIRLAKRDRIDMELGLEVYRRICAQNREHGARVEVGLHW